MAARITLTTFVHFVGCATAAEVARHHKALVRQHHPDLGGDTATMAAINAEFDAVCELFRRDAAGASWKDQVRAGARSALWDRTRGTSAANTPRWTYTPEDVYRAAAETARREQEAAERARQEAEAAAERARQEAEAAAEREAQARAARSRGGRSTVETIWEAGSWRVEVDRARSVYVIYDRDGEVYRETYTGSNWRQTRKEVIERAKREAGLA